MTVFHPSSITLRAACALALVVGVGCGPSGTIDPSGGEAGEKGSPATSRFEPDTPPSAPREARAGTLTVASDGGSTLRGSFAARGRELELFAAASGALSGEIRLGAAGLAYELAYDFAARRVVADGHGTALDPLTHGVLLDAVAAVAESLGAARPGAPLHVQMLYAALVLWHESGGAPLGRISFELDPPDIEKSRADDGVLCVRRGQTYAVSFDYGATTIEDAAVTADEHRCNGRCGPYCTALTPFTMWTLDCLEHDQCCRETDDETCWTPFNECGDEYLEAETDFLRGLDPFSSHCGG